MAASLFVRQHGRWPESESLLPRRLGRLLAQGREITGRGGWRKPEGNPGRDVSLRWQESTEAIIHNIGGNREGLGNRQDEYDEHFEGRTEKLATCR